MATVVAGDAISMAKSSATLCEAISAAGLGLDERGDMSASCSRISTARTSGDSPPPMALTVPDYWDEPTPALHFADTFPSTGSISGLRMEATVTSELSNADGRQGAHRPVAHLFVILDCERLHEAPSRYSLDGITTIHIGRGEKQAAVRRGSGTDLFLTIPNERMSSEHARIRATDDGWVIEDVGSKNGTWVNGLRVGGLATLPFGAIIQAGHAFMSVRTSSAPALADVTGLRSTSNAFGTTTLLPALAERFAQLATVARTSTHVVILGETGSGKDVVANAYHQLTQRRGAFVPLNCGALAESMLEDTLFGHRKGAYTGATAENRGLVRAADGGTLFLDEIGDLPLPAQSALLRVIEAREVLPIGATKPVRVDVRIVCATHRNIPEMIMRGQFRPDLWARIAGFVLDLPPLRARLEDMGLLVSAAVRRHAPDRADRIRLSLTAAVNVLVQRRWPLNVRELMNVFGRALALAKDDALSSDLLPDVEDFDLGSVDVVEPGATIGRPPMAAATEPGSLAEWQRETLVKLLLAHEGNVSAVARELGKDRTLVHRWIKKLGIDADEYRPSIVALR